MQMLQPESASSEGGKVQGLLLSMGIGGNVLERETRVLNKCTLSSIFLFVKEVCLGALNSYRSFWLACLFVCFFLIYIFFETESYMGDRLTDNHIGDRQTELLRAR